MFVFFFGKILIGTKKGQKNNFKLSSTELKKCCADDAVNKGI